MYTISPCKDCTKRTVMCHAECIKYNEWLKVINIEREQEKEDKYYSVAYVSTFYPKGKTKRKHKKQSRRKYL